MNRAWKRRLNKPANRAARRNAIHILQWIAAQERLLVAQ